MKFFIEKVSGEKAELMKAVTRTRKINFTNIGNWGDEIRASGNKINPDVQSRWLIIGPAASIHQNQTVEVTRADGSKTYATAVQLLFAIVGKKKWWMTQPPEHVVFQALIARPTYDEYEDEYEDDDEYDDD